MSRSLTYVQALNEATDQCMAADPDVYIMGLGVTDPNGILGGTSGLLDRHGASRVMDMP